MVSTSLLFRLQGLGIRISHSARSLCEYSTVAQPLEQSQMVNYLIDSLGFSEKSACATTQKAHKYNSFRNNPDLFVKFMKELGLNNDEIKRLICESPSLLTNNVAKTLEPKIRVFLDLGLSGSDLVKMLAVYNFLNNGVEAQKRIIEYLRNFLGSTEKVVKAIKKCSLLLHNQAPQKIESGISILRDLGCLDDQVNHCLLYFPNLIYYAESKWFQDIVYRVENDLGIPRHSRMFYHGIKYCSFMSKSTLDEKINIFQCFGWSDPNIKAVLRSFPSVLGISKDSIRTRLSFFMTELSYAPEFLITNPVLFCLNFEKMKLRNEVLTVLNEKKLNQRRASFAGVLRLPDSKFMENYLLPYQDVFPQLYDSYIETIRK